MATTVATPAANGADRRKSGRTSHKPQVFSQEVYDGSLLNSSKRKRRSDAANSDDEEDEDDNGNNEMTPDDGDDESESDDADDEPDEEELREQRRKQRAKNTVAKPAAKRSKTTNGASTTLAIRSAKPARRPASKQAQQKARSRPSQIQGTGLYAEVFGKGNDAETAATRWRDEMVKDNVSGLANIINFILRCVGCESSIENNDIEDVDNVSSKLGDIVNEYGSQKEADYPLSSKQKQYHGMKDVLTEFFKAVIHSLHNSNTIYEEPAVYDNIHVWTATMTSAGYRSFRHTATVISLAMTTGLTEVAQELQSSIATTKQQVDAEKKKKTANKGRLTKLQKEMSEDEKKLETIDTLLKDAFDTVYIHRYRDVDEKIRTDCVVAIGNWILNYRKMFLEGQYLRYIGWVIADPNPLTRLEVIRVLKTLFKQKQNIPALRAFTERFRTRIVEIGTRDADTTVRTETIDLLDKLRNAELLEPQDIETIGQLIFDSGPRIRKAVAKFFVSNIEDLYNASIDDFDKDQFNEVLPDADDTPDFETPSKLWIKFKCLAQTLGTQDGSKTGSSGTSLEAFRGDQSQSRYMVATQDIFHTMPELQHWEALAGYLLHDHSHASSKKGKADFSSTVRKAYELESGEDMVLIDVLYCATKLSLQQLAEDIKANKSKRTRDDAKEKQELAASNLAVFIPQLHSKFGSTARGAKTILKLHQLFDADLVDDVHDEDANHTALLDNVNTHFVTYTDTEVLAEASRALRTALHHESSKEAADAKASSLWQEASQSLGVLLNGKSISGRGTLERHNLQRVVDIVARFAHLAGINDCSEVLESRMPWPKSKANQSRKESLLSVLIQLIKRGEPDDDTPREPARLEDQLCRLTLKTLSFYYRWKIVSLRAAVSGQSKEALSATSLRDLAMRKTDLVEALLPVLTPRKPLDRVRIAGLMGLLELYVLFATVRHMKPSGAGNSLSNEVQISLQGLVTEIDDVTMKASMETHEKMEKRLAQKLGKKNIELPLHEAKKARRRQAREGSTRSDATGTNGNFETEKEAIDRPPEDSDDEETQANAREKTDNQDSDDSSSDAASDISEAIDDEATGKNKTLARHEAKKKTILIAENSLCELTAKIVLAVIAGIVPHNSDIRKRLQVNRNKLGKNYSSVIAYLDDKKEDKKTGGKARKDQLKTPTKKSGSNKATKPMLSEPLVLSDDDIEDDDEDVRREDDDPEVLRAQGLEDVEESEHEQEGAKAVAEDNIDDDSDEVMGD